MRRLITASCSVRDTEQLRTLLSVLRSWLLKDPSNESLLKLAFRFRRSRHEKPTRPESSLLLVQCLELPTKTTSDLTERLRIGKRTDLRTFDFFFPVNGVDANSRNNLPPDEIERFWALNNWSTLISSTYNLVASVSPAIVTDVLGGEFARRVFEQQLAALATPYTGPFHDLNFNIVMLGFNSDSPIRGWAAANADLMSKHGAKERNLLTMLRAARPRRKLELTPAENAKHSQRMDLARSRALSRIDRLFGGRRPSPPIPKPEGGKNPALQREVDATLEHQVRHRQKYGDWGEIIASPQITRLILEPIIAAFHLAPATQWLEALRVRLLPGVAERLRIFDQSRCSSIAERLKGDPRDQTATHLAGWYLLLDCWLKINGFYNSTRKSGLEDLVTMTRESDSPPLKIAQCVRDIANGEESRIADLRALVGSRMTEYKGIFERAFWRDSTN